MRKVFNVNGACRPAKHYMVNLESRLAAIRVMVDDGAYFTINRARQYGKTTTLKALAEYLREDYVVVSLDFQRMSSSDFAGEASFVNGLAREVCRTMRRRQEIPETLRRELGEMAKDKTGLLKMAEIFDCFSDWCEESGKPVILIVDEVDTASNNQVFLDFLAQLRAHYLSSDETPTFQSVILAGVYDIRNIKRKIRPDEEHKVNSPWNISARFDIDMSFSTEDISGMLEEYEADYDVGMDVGSMAEWIYRYTSGYPYFVSQLCKMMDEEIAGSDKFPDRASAWTKEGFLAAEKLLSNEDNALYQSLIGKLEFYPELREMLYKLLFNGRPIPYTATNSCIKDATMFGFIREQDGTAVISNRIFEAVLYNYFTAEEFTASRMYSIGIQAKNQFIVGGHLDIRRILEKFVEVFGELYSEKDEAFLEDVGRKYFILFLKPIINGVGNYCIEPQTRDSDRMDLVIYYREEQNILELKIWRGNAYHERGEKQLSGYLDYFHMKKGYMLSFNFNKVKETGVKEIRIGDKVLIEAVV